MSSPPVWLSWSGVMAGLGEGGGEGWLLGFMGEAVCLILLSVF